MIYSIQIVDRPKATMMEKKFVFSNYEKLLQSFPESNKTFQEYTKFKSVATISL